MQQKNFRIHGDNFIECERLLSYLFAAFPADTRPACAITYPSLSTKQVSFSYQGISYQITLLSGFNKGRKERWETDIFKTLKTNGSIIDETPDAVFTQEESGHENILCAVEFCSALQAGNQAWQRSGRAWSTGRAGCPYLYIVDIGKKELNPQTREEKATRFPNPLVPYSYVSFSEATRTLVAEVAVPGGVNPIFGNGSDADDADFFAQQAISEYLLALLTGRDTSALQQQLIRKNKILVTRLAQTRSRADNTQWGTDVWEDIIHLNEDVYTYAAEPRNALVFSKKVAAKSLSLHTQELLNLLKKTARGCASADMPFGIIPKEKRAYFSQQLQHLLPLPDSIAKNDKDLIVCLLKGFKPRGDDARPDRGALPFIQMLNRTELDVLLYVYGPIYETSQEQLKKGEKSLLMKNGLWNTFFSLSDYLLIDSPIVSSADRHYVQFLDNTLFKRKRLERTGTGRLRNRAVSLNPKRYQEEDVDFALHNLFTDVLKDTCFEGMCNPPGGDWSGISLQHKGKEYRWLSLPRQSSDKRPDHVIQIQGRTGCPFLLLIESKEKRSALEQEKNVGTRMKQYLKQLFFATPNAERTQDTWAECSALLSADEYNMVSAGAYICEKPETDTAVPQDSSCDMLFLLKPETASKSWEISIRTATPAAAQLAQLMQSELQQTPGPHPFRLRLQ